MSIIYFFYNVYSIFLLAYFLWGVLLTYQLLYPSGPLLHRMITHSWNRHFILLKIYIYIYIKVFLLLFIYKDGNLFRQQMCFWVNIQIENILTQWYKMRNVIQWCKKSIIRNVAHNELTFGIHSKSLDCFLLAQHIAGRETKWIPDLLIALWWWW